MPSPLAVRGLKKSYPGFTLGELSFSLREGAVTGFIGRNGAGKTTTLKSLLDLVHPDAGEISFFGLEGPGHEREIKQRIGFVSGGFRFYPAKTLGAITAVTRRFYPAWDDGAYRRYLQRFSLDENKSPKQLSEGMKVKYALALALSHGASLLLLDEPTSGLDPVSRDELLQLFLSLAAEGTTILFSTHITSDLEKCADDLLYLKAGRLSEQGGMEAVLSRYRLLRWTGETPRGVLIGPGRDKTGSSALVRADFLPAPGVGLEKASLEDLMVHMEREESI